MPKKFRIYVDTSIIGGCCDPEFEVWSKSLLADFSSGKFELLLSVLTDAEIRKAPKAVKTTYLQFRKCTKAVVKLSPEVIGLAEAYLDHKILPRNYASDARHIALATIAGADVLVSWNFRHIVHFEKIQKFNAVNIEFGYKPILIYSPREVTSHVRSSR
jgi:hypothetical protein